MSLRPRRRILGPGVRLQTEQDPERPIPVEQHVMVSPADGTVSDITEKFQSDLLGGEGYWEGESVILPMNVCVAVLSLVQYLTEDTHLVAGPLVGPAIKLNNLIGAEVHEQGDRS